MARLLSDRELLSALLEPPYVERLGEKQAEIFTEWDEERRVLTEKMCEWIRDAAERVGLQTSPGKNLFSSLSPERQRIERAKAKKILPWE